MKVTIRFNQRQERLIGEAAKNLGITKQAIVQEGVNLFELAVREFAAGKSVEEVRAKIKQRIAKFTRRATVEHSDLVAARQLAHKLSTLLDQLDGARAKAHAKHDAANGVLNSSFKKLAAAIAAMDALPDLGSFRMESGLTQRQMAHLCGVSDRKYWALEKSGSKDDLQPFRNLFQNARSQS